MRKHTHYLSLSLSSLVVHTEWHHHTPLHPAFYCCQLLSYDDTTLDFAEVHHMTAHDINQDSQRE